jgi:gamma-glutamylputrescine oxidase
MSDTLTRRGFLKRTAAATAGTAAGVAALNYASPHVLPEQAIFQPNRSHWAKYEIPANPSLTQDLEADVAIIGGGYTGLSSAYYILKNAPSRKVVVLEARQCGNGASGRNGAMVLTLTADRFMEFSTDPAMDKRIYDLTVENIGTLREVSSAAGIDCELDTRGALEVFNNRPAMEAGKAYIEKARSLGFPFEFWDGPRTKNALGSNLYLGALFDPNSGQVHPMKLAHTWKAAAEGVGAKIFENTPVVSIEEGSTHRLRTSTGREVKAKSLVLATNAYTSKMGQFGNALVPLHAYIGITPPLSESTINEIGWRSRLPFFDSRTLVYYLGLTRDNRIHIGGGRVDYSLNNDLAERSDGQSAHAALKRELVRIFPGLAGVNFETAWSGLVDMTLDFAPTVGRTGKHGNVYYGLGYCGHGVNLTSLFGRIIADLELGRGERLDTLPFVNRTPLYVPNEPFRWLGVQAALEYYRSSDHIE